MKKMNTRMMAMYNDMPAEQIPIVLEKELQKILDEGFIQENGCIFLRRLYKLKGNSTIIDFSDKTGYECFVNHIHIDDLIENPKIQDAISFTHALLLNVKNYLQDHSQVVSVILSIDAGDQTVRFHLKRKGENWLSDNLEGYKEEAILQIEE